MSMSNEYQPINCDDYDNLEATCQQHLTLTVELRNGEIITGKASDMVSRKHIEYLVLEDAGHLHELRLDHILSFSHPEIGKVVVSEP
ncbi:Rho-binding antiterminator [Pectobacteriaceae bacterium CE70]|uniref:Rho-binding antiterminator n=1 Tax=Serratia sp. (strain ATCC 39006) TaxID=104623 RepID=A0A2I5TNF8_SERS3|nr:MULTISPECIES: Rho-binding antiterminator [Enterobacterales]WJV59353.1 Rho-binding antiterminator [Pectobacteriaceae bacterium C111]WJV63599.1 Rho-binding antiterminator [Pectobacteriaceae bacterium C52]WJV67990.1 Rho-binding antiterminator [Pectobacteriaceae bacterium CE70]WJY11932.1 Rho-binding antiterminator [Pectobacteriaceae bacterium C80]WJY14112.1 Rho-binding antiterminator [Pectobacteriaceae bacterium CE90]